MQAPLTFTQSRDKNNFETIETHRQEEEDSTGRANIRRPSQLPNNDDRTESTSHRATSNHQFREIRGTPPVTITTPKAVW